MLWNSWFRRRQWEKRMDAEFRFHMENQVREYMSEGASREEAEQRARREFGAVELTKDECRDQRPVPRLDHFLRDVGYAWRLLKRSPGFALAAAATLALGIGANAAILSVAYTVLWKPLPYSRPDQIYSVSMLPPKLRPQFDLLPMRIQDFLEWRKSAGSISQIATFTPENWSLTGDGEPEHAGGARVSANFFSFLGVPLALGRGFSADEEQPGKDRVVVISDALWRRRYGADPALVGKTIRLDGEPHVVAGIAPASLLVPTGAAIHTMLQFASRIDIWKPLAPAPSELEGENWNQEVLVRPKPGISVEAGRQELQAMLNRMVRAEVPDLKVDLVLRLTPIREIYSGRIRPRLMLILAASALLLLIACLNIANLFLARIASRTAEFATRVALGAARGRVMAQILTESALVAVIGGAAGAVLARYGTRLLITYGPDDLRRAGGADFTVAVILFSLLIGLATAAICGSIPAWQASRQNGIAGLGAARSGLSARNGRLREVLIGVETALATALLACSGLLLHSFVKLMGADRGYTIEHILTADPIPAGKREPVSFFRELVANVRGLPGVLAVGAISDLPADAESSGTLMTVFYSTDTNFNSVVMQRPVTLIRSVTPGYFAANEYTLKAGRFLSDEDRAPSAVISVSLARTLWPGVALADIVGRAFREGEVTAPLVTIVGIVGDVHPASLDRELPPQIYRPHSQRPSEAMSLAVRSAEDPAVLARAVRAEIRKMDADIPIPTLRTMREIVSESVASRRFQMALTWMFAMLALALGAVGVYGVVSYSVASRTREIGVRAALGASPVSLLRWVFANGMRPVLAGLVAGSIAAAAIAGTLRGLLFGIAATDPLSFGCVATVLLLISGLACFLPARRAARMDPIAALRQG